MATNLESEMETRVVPVEPTENMLAAIVAANCSHDTAYPVDGMRRSIRIYRAMLAASQPAQTCSWSQDGEDSDMWATRCGNYFVVNEGSPSENKFAFCCYCGKHLEEHPHTNEDDEQPAQTGEFADNGGDNTGSAVPAEGETPLVQQLRALARYAHDDHSLGNDAAVEIERL
jgi:hypothetical protein